MHKWRMFQKRNAKGTQRYLVHRNGLGSESECRRGIRVQKHGLPCGSLFNDRIPVDHLDIIALDTGSSRVVDGGMWNRRLRYEQRKDGAAIRGLKVALDHERSVGINPNSLIEAGKFEELETASKAYEAAFKLDSLAESNLMKLYMDIRQCRSPGRDLLPQLDRWVETRPSYMSLAARGTYFAELGYMQGGGELIPNTPPSQLAAMRASHERALRDLEAALRLNPKFVPTYIALMKVHHATGSLEQAAAAVGAATKEIPKTYYIRGHYLRTLRPKW